MPQTETARVRAWIAADEIVGRVGADRQGNEFLKASIHGRMIGEIEKSFKKGVLAVDTAKWFRYNSITVADRLPMEIDMFEVYVSNAYYHDVLVRFDTEDEAVSYLKDIRKVFHIEADVDYPGCWDAIDKAGFVYGIERK